MHYIKQCLEPGRILNYIDRISYKRKRISNNLNPKQAGMIELQLTDQCNLNCFHCHFREKGDQFFEEEWIDLVLNEISPKAISLAGGGEPTLYPDFNKTICRLKNGDSNPQIGLITNGVFIPEGEWPGLLSWLRVSLYSVTNHLYAGRDPAFQQKVISNIETYMNMDQLSMLGVSLLYYHGNAVDCIRLSYILYKLLKKSKRQIDRFNIQFKRAFVLSDPEHLNESVYHENRNFIPGEQELLKAIQYKEQLCLKDPGFDLFLSRCANFEQMEDFARNGRERAIAQLNPDRLPPQNFANCFVVLENRLITPDGYAYSCPSIAENRKPQFALGHILDQNSEYTKNILKYYNCNSAWCNTRFCRHSQHNQLVQQYLDTGRACTYGREILEDNFF